MQIWPAIDLRGGKCVRLRQGDYTQETVFGDDPVAMARRWLDEGARHLHLVDLDGARGGRLVNGPAVQAIVDAIDIPCELGGGVRDEETIVELLKLGLSRLVVGTKALREPKWFRQMVDRYPRQLALGLDARDGFVATDGWLTTSNTPATRLAVQFADQPLAAIIYTDIGTDGMLAGPNLAAMEEMREAVDLPLIASGGVACADDVAALRAVGVDGCIIGRALYEGTLTMAEALAAGHENEPISRVRAKEQPMAKHNVEDIRNIAFCGHGSAGKTTLVDALLVRTKAVDHPASVDNGTSICDFDEEEKAHKYTIEAKVTHFDYDGKHFQVIDTPGYPDFIGQTLEALRGADNAAIVINAHAGIEVNTRRVFEEAGKEGLGRMIIIDKMDADNIDFPALLEKIKAAFGPACVPFDIPVGGGHDFRGVIDELHVPAKSDGALVDPGPIHTALIENIIEIDEEATAHYFEGIEPSDEELKKLIVEAVATGHLIPIMCCSAKTGVGMDELLSDLALCALPPNKVRRRAKQEGGESQDLAPDPNGPLVAQVFKTRIDPFVQRLSFIRVYSGTLKKETQVPIAGARKGTKLHQLFKMQANVTEPIDEAGPGEIVAVTKNEDLHVGSVLGDHQMEPIHFPTPMVGLAVTPKSRGDEGKLSGALHKLVEEDPTLRVEHDPQTHELVINGMSELHLQLIREKLKRRDKVEVDAKQPKIPYRETVMHIAEGSYRHKKQSGGRGQFGEVHIRIYPLPEGTKIEEYAVKERFPSMRDYRHDPKINFLWVDSIVGGTIPNNFLPAVEKGFRERMDRGVIAGYKVQNVAVEVYFGKHHPVDSSEAAFKTAGSMAFRNVFQQAKPALLEPIVKLHVTVPSEKLGDINSDMSGRRGRVLGMDSAGGDMQTVIAEVPLSEVTTYARSLSSITGGQGSFTMEFSRYDVVPGNVQKEIVEKAVLMKEEEEE